MNALIIIPTYNEAENLPLLIRAIFSLKIGDTDQLSILVVDDNSPDKTGDLAEGLRKDYPRLNVLHRLQKEGLGKAYLDGISFALKNFDFDALIQMDADFSHDPNDIPRLIAQAKEADVVIGSRHIKGSRLGYPWYRRLLSYTANLYARVMLGLPTNDCTAGFRIYRREVWEKIIRERYFSNGYAFQVETLFHVRKAGFSVKEIPVTFIDRTRGKSKMSKNNVSDGFWGILRVRVKNLYSFNLQRAFSRKS